MVDSPVITVEGVSKTFKLPHEKQNTLKGALINFNKRGYEAQEALKDVSFTVNKGDFFGIVGRNGSGKSTLLKLLAGIYTPDKGDIQIQGKLIPFIELGVGFNPELTGRENIFLNGALLGFNRKEVDEMYDEIVEFAELERFMDQRLKNYSSGMQVRLAFSIAIRAQGDILLLDEVLAVGDAAFQQKCYNYFEKLKEQKRTVVFVSHSMDAVRRFCTRAIYIEDGHLTHQGSPSEIADVYLEENMESSRTSKAKSDPKAAKVELSAKTVNQTNDNLVIEFTYASKEKSAMHIGLSVIKDGISVAELNTTGGKELTNSGKVSYTLDLKQLNAGVYQVGAGIFKSTNSELLGMTTEKTQFIVKGADLTRGGALKLADTWKYE